VGISTVYQNLALVGCRSVVDNLFLGREPVRYGILRRRMMREEAQRAVSELKQMNLTDMDAQVSDLSGGQRQALAIARGVRLGKRVLILDEPTAALGVRESSQVLDLIEQLKASARSIMIVSHNLAHVFRVADRITVLRGGRRVATVEKARTDPDAVVGLITGAREL
jgi:ABC-type sugar transport system ATPase subunit